MYADDLFTGLHIPLQTIKPCRLTLIHYLIGFQSTSYSLTVQPCKSMLVTQKRDSTMPITLLIDSQPLKR